MAAETHTTPHEIHSPSTPPTPAEPSTPAEPMARRAPPLRRGCRALRCHFHVPQDPEDDDDGYASDSRESSTTSCRASCSPEPTRSPAAPSSSACASPAPSHPQSPSARGDLSPRGRALLEAFIDNIPGDVLSSISSFVPRHAPSPARGDDSGDDGPAATPATHPQHFRSYMLSTWYDENFLFSLRDCYAGYIVAEICVLTAPADAALAGASGRIVARFRAIWPPGMGIVNLLRQMLFHHSLGQWGIQDSGNWLGEVWEAIRLGRWGELE